MHVEPAAAVAVPLTGVILSLLIHRATRKQRVPPVVVFLSVGIAMRAVFRPMIDADALVAATRPFTNACLALIGVVIGSHLNADALGAVGTDFVTYVVVLLATTFAVVHSAAMLLFPSQHLFARLTASIALERSSPEALAGVQEARASGTFTTVTILTAAAMDSLAILAFTIATASLGAGSAILSVAQTLLTTFLAGVLGVASFVLTAPWQRPVATATVFVLVLLLCNHFLHFELIASAIGVGTWVNFRHPHAVTHAVERFELPIQAVLFTLAGCRVDVLKFSPAAIGGAVGLFAARIAGLCIGASLGASAAGYPTYHSRGFGLVTQIAIALALVNRMEELFPQSATLAMATMGSVLLGLFTGPLALQLALRFSGEAGKAAGGGAGGGGDGGGTGSGHGLGRATGARSGAGAIGGSAHHSDHDDEDGGRRSGTPMSTAVRMDSAAP